MGRRSRKKKEPTNTPKEAPPEEESTPELEENPQTDPISEESGSAQVFSDDAYPERGELVVATCTKVSSHGAYFSLYEYDHLSPEVGFIHISELSRTWIRNIKSHIREGQRVVAKVLRVDSSKNEIDMSVRRVTESQKRSKMQQMKYEQHAKNLVRVVGEELKFDQDQQTEYRRIMGTKFESVYDALTEARNNGEEVLIEAGIPKDVAIALTRVAETRLEAPSVILVGTATTEVRQPKGIDILKKSYSDVTKKIPKLSRTTKIRVASLSAPNYRIEIEASDWKEAEKAWKEVQKVLERSLGKKASKMAFERT